MNNNSKHIIGACKEPYIVNGVIWIPIIVMMTSITYMTKQTSALFVVGCLLIGLACIFGYIHSLRLALTNNKITYCEGWNVKELLFEEISSIKHGPKLAYVNVRWIVEAKDPSKSFIVNIANFDRKKLGSFVTRLREIAPNIDVQV